MKDMCIEAVYSSFVKPETKLIAMLKATAIILSFLDHVKLSAGFIHMFSSYYPTVEEHVGVR